MGNYFNTGLFDMLVKGGVDNDVFDSCLVQASCAGNTEIVLVAAKSGSYLLPQLPHDFHANKSIGILKVAGKHGGFNSLIGVAVLLRSDFLGDPSCSYLCCCRIYCSEHWLAKDFSDGIRQGQEHYMNIVRILKWGESPVSLDLLAPEMRAAIACHCTERVSRHQAAVWCRKGCEGGLLKL
ncbi:hypothetical protein EV2_016340 [Malus domestica]